MSENDDHRLDLRALLDAVEAAPPVEAVDVLARELATMLGATAVSLLLTNFSGDAVVRVSHAIDEQDTHDGGNERTESLALPGSSYEEVLQRQQMDVRRTSGGWQLLMPVTERGDAMGILEFSLPHAPVKEELEYAESAAHALAFVLIATRRHTDLFEWAQRDTKFSLAAEIQRRLLPSAYTVEGGPFTVAGWLEPASTVGGDTFDYSVDREYLYASLTDAMGHSTAAAMLATLTVGSLRNSRRAIASPGEQAAAANRALLESSDADQFVTGLVLRVRLADGAAEFVNAGHPSPFLLRRGQAREVDIPADPALGVLDTEHHTYRLDLQPGDRLLLVTDGFLERNAVSVDIPSTLEENAGRHPREFVRELAKNVLIATGGNLRDDAAVLCIDWYGPGAIRDDVAGASRSRATT